MDSCGCQIERKMASDFLAKQVFRGKGKELGSFKVNDRRFKVYSTKDGFRYECDQCPILIITLEVTMEELNKGDKTMEGVMSRLSSVKGLTVNPMMREVVEKVMSVVG